MKTHALMKPLVLSALLAAAACKSSDGNPAQDGGADAGADGGMDAGMDAGPNTDPNVWTARDLGVGRATAVNSAGLAVVIDDTDQANATSLIDLSGARTSLGAFDGGTMAIGVAIASSGDVAGYAESSAGRTAAVYSGGSWKPLGGLGGASWSVATAIDDSGAVAGIAGQRDGSMRAFLWSGGAAQSLPVPDGGSSAAYALGAGGRLAGILETASGATHPFSIAGSALTDLGVLAGGTNATAYALSDSGEVVGSSEFGGSVRHAFSAAPGGALVDLGVPAGFAWSEARGLDATGRIALNAVTASGVSKARVIFPASHAPFDLTPKDASGVPFSSAHAAMMTREGRVAGWGAPQGGGVHAIVWTPGGVR